MPKQELPITDGSFAYNINLFELPNESAAVQQQPQLPPELPEEKPEPRKKKVVKAKLEVSPLALIGLLVVTALLAMVVYGYVQLYEATNRAGELQQELDAVKDETGKLRSAYESRINLAQIEQRAKELGMNQPSIKQTVYLNIAGTDHTEVFEVDHRNFAEKAIDAVSSSFEGILEYFR